MSNIILDVSAEDLKIIRQILADCIPNHTVWAFGSRVKGTARKFSDLDLAVINQSPLDFPTFAELKERFSESTLPFKVDVIDWANTDENFKKIIEENYLVIFPC